MSSWNSSCLSTLQNRKTKQITRLEVNSPIKIHHCVWLVCKTRAKILLSDPKTSLTTPRLLSLMRSRRSNGNHKSSQSSGSSRNFLKRLGLSGRSGRWCGNQALGRLHMNPVDRTGSVSRFHLTSKSRMCSYGSRKAGSIWTLQLGYPDESRMNSGVADGIVLHCLLYFAHHKLPIQLQWCSLKSCRWKAGWNFSYFNPRRNLSCRSGPVWSTGRAQVKRP